MAKQVKQDTTALVVVVQGRAMASAEKELAEKDAQLFLSTKQTRKDLVAIWAAAGRTSADWDKPEGDACAAFYTELVAVSRTAAESGMSKLGLTEAELIQFPVGYSIATVTDAEVKPSQLPDWASETGRIGKLSIRRYHQQQVMGWFRSTLKSMAAKEEKDQLISGGANALTKAKAQLTVDNLGAALKRDCDAGEGELILGIKFAKDLRAQINKIVAANEGCTLPKFMTEKS
jgi:hypothetical protein